MTYYWFVAYIAVTWARTFRAGERSLDEKAESLKLGSTERIGLRTLSGVVSALCAGCVGIAAWASVGFILAAVRSFAQ